MNVRHKTAAERLATQQADTRSALYLLPPLEFPDAWDIFDAGDGATLLVAEAMNLPQFAAVRRQLEQAGFLAHSESCIGDNCFCTLLQGDVTVDLWHIGYAAELRLVAQKGIPLLPSAMPCEVTAEKQQPVFVAIGGYGEYSGMTFVIRLENGGFVIIDGGNGDGMWRYTYEAMRDLAPDPARVVIESWIFTHTHSDHIDAFLQYAAEADALGKAVVLKNVVANFAAPEQAGVPTQGLFETDEMIRKVLQTVLPSVPFYKVHPGNVLRFPGMTAEVLGTHESFTSLAEEWPFLFNACNLMLKITVAGQVIAIEADNDACNNTVLGKTYGDYLRCDILQADHHGNFGGVCEVNALFAPEVVVYCHYASQSEEYLAADYNQTLLQHPRFKEYLVTDTHRITMTLPYTPGTARREKLQP